MECLQCASLDQTKSFSCLCHSLLCAMLWRAPSWKQPEEQFLCWPCPARSSCMVFPYGTYARDFQCLGPNWAPARTESNRFKANFGPDTFFHCLNFFYPFLPYGERNAFFFSPSSLKSPRSVGQCLVKNNLKMNKFGVIESSCCCCRFLALLSATSKHITTIWIPSTLLTSRSVWKCFSTIINRDCLTCSWLGKSDECRAHNSSPGKTARNQETLPVLEIRGGFHWPKKKALKEKRAGK